MLEKIYSFFGVVSKKKYDTLWKKYNIIKIDYDNLKRDYQYLKEKPIDIQNDLNKAKSLIQELEDRDRKLRKGLGLDEYTQALMKAENTSKKRK